MYLLDNLGSLAHKCYSHPNALTCPSPEQIISWKYYEDGYFRGMKKGHTSKFLNRTASQNFVRCKACGEEIEFDDQGEFNFPLKGD